MTGNFYHLLELGEHYEQLTQETFFKKFKNKRLITNCNNFKYDFKVITTKTEKITKYEVKTDFKVQYTNNLFIEYLQSNKPSGIQTTKAKYYIFCCIDDDKTEILEFIVISVKNIKEMITYNRYNSIYKTFNYSGYIFDKDIIISNSKYHYFSNSF